MSNVRRYPAIMVDSCKAYLEAMSSTVKFLLAKNYPMKKDLQEARKRTEQSVGSTMAEMRKVKLIEV